MALDDLELYEDPAVPFTLAENAMNLVIWPLGLAHLSGWLGVFTLLDRTVMSGQRFDKLGKLVCRLATSLAGVRVRRQGLHHLDPGTSYVFCVNHVSLLDLFVVFQSIPHFHRSFQDAAHFKIPIYGHCIRLFGQLPVERGNRRLNYQAFEHAKELLRGGDSFLVFPEGHRTRDGRLGPFHSGAFRLAIQAGTPVVPMCLRGLRAICPAGDFRIRPGTVDVLFGDPIPTQGLSMKDVEPLSQRTHAIMNEILRRGSV